MTSAISKWEISKTGEGIGLAKTDMEEIMKAQKLESVEILAARIAHDFNNSLTAILANVSLARMYGDPSDKSLEKLVAAEREIMHAKRLTQQLLRLSTGGTPVDETASIMELLKDCASLATRGSKVKCELSIADDLWSVKISEDRVNQVLCNIIINADQAMPNGGVINIRAENMVIGKADRLSLKAGRYVRLSIEDQGIGIPADELHNIFRLYFTTKPKGTGLGLATSNIIVREHGGLICVESQVDIGTIFHIYLPASSAKAPAQKLRMGHKPIMGAGRILVMDDEKYIRDLASEILDQIGYEITTAVNGVEAVKLYQEARDSGQPYDVVIVDLTVPGGMGGKETIQELRRIDPEVKAIICSGYADDPIMTGFREYGFKSAIDKPYETIDLSVILHEILA